MEYSKLRLKAIKLKAQAEQHLVTAKETKAAYEAKREALRKEKESQGIQQMSIEVLTQIVDKLSHQHVDRIVDLVTYALQTIFHDKQYSVEIVLSDKRNSKTAEFLLVEKLNDGTILKSSFDDGIGGGVLAVVGCVLQIYFISLLNLAPIIFVDEGFSQVSAQYIEPLLMFFDELAESRGFIIVLITHDSRLMKKAVHKYVVNDGEVVEVK